MKLLEKRIEKINKRLRGFKAKPDWWGDGLGTRGKNLGFMQDEKFKKAEQLGYEANKPATEITGFDPRIPWRTHLCIWAAKNALRLEGDFVECGVHTGMLSKAVCEYLDFDKTGKKFYLFDTFAGVPTEGLSETEKKDADKFNGLYFDVYEVAKSTFSNFRNVELVKGTLPQSLNNVKLSKIAYLSIDLNSAKYEKETIEAIWDKLVPGAMVIIDDYAFMGHIPQYEMWNEFAKKHDRLVFTVPTGQGLLQK